MSFGDAKSLQGLVLRKLITLAVVAAAFAPLSAAQAQSNLGGGLLQWMAQGAAPHAAPADAYGIPGLVVGPAPKSRVERVGGANVLMATVPPGGAAAGYVDPNSQPMMDAALKADPLQPDSADAHAPIPPEFQRQEVDYDGAERPGTIIINTEDRLLYFVLPGHRAIRYGVGVGRPGFEWAGVKSVTRKAEWPDWTPPVEMMLRRPDIPDHMAGGIDNPLGARALYLGSSLYRIHGTNEPWTIGHNVSSGCIRMMNADVIDLYGRAKVGTRVVVL